MINLHEKNTRADPGFQVHVPGRHGVRPGELHLRQLVRNRLSVVDVLLRQEPATVPGRRQFDGVQRDRNAVRAAAAPATGAAPAAENPRGQAAGAGVQTAADHRAARAQAAGAPAQSVQDHPGTAKAAGGSTAEAAARSTASPRSYLYLT